MTSIRPFRVGMGISLCLHAFVICSPELRGMLFWDLPRTPERPGQERLVFDLEAAPPPPPPLLVRPKEQARKTDPVKPKVKQFVDMTVNQKDAPAPKDTNLIGLKNSIAKDNAPKGKKADGTPKLDGKSEVFGAHNRPESPGPFNPGTPGAAAAPPMAAGKADKAPSSPAPPKPAPAPTAPKTVAQTAPPPKPIEVKTPPAPKPVQSNTPPTPKPSPEPAPSAKPASVALKDVGPDGLLPRPAVPPPQKIEVREQKKVEPPKKPVEVAALPAPKPLPETEPPAKQPPASQKEVLSPRMSASMPQPMIPPPGPAEARKSSPDSSAGEQGEEAFNIKMDEYAKYYKHVAKRISSTLEILYGGDMSFITPKPKEEKIIVDFRIQRSGEIANLKLVSDGGDYLLASMIVSSIQKTLLDALPPYVKEGQLKIRYTFYFR